MESRIFFNGSLNGLQIEPLRLLFRNNFIIDFEMAFNRDLASELAPKISIGLSHFNVILCGLIRQTGREPTESPRGRQREANVSKMKPTVYQKRAKRSKRELKVRRIRVLSYLHRPGAGILP